jgi:hypothetical protein
VVQGAVLFTSGIECLLDFVVQLYADILSHNVTAL